MTYTCDSLLFVGLPLCVCTTNQIEIIAELDIFDTQMIMIGGLALVTHKVFQQTLAMFFDPNKVFQFLQNQK
jgi:hypothetical protein